MLRDAESSCDELISATQLTEEAAAWRISCTDAHVYMLTVDRFGELQIDHIAYREGLPLQAPILLESETER